MKVIMTLAVVLLVVAMTMAALLWNGTFNFAADEPHWSVTHDMINFARERSIDVRKDRVQAPDLADAALVSSGAGNYDAMCTGCHLKPGLETSELSAALYPQPIDLTSTRESDPLRDFLIIKHGIKMSGMPAWGKSMGDDYIWGMVAFLQKLPEQTPESYAAMIEASGGHQHDGGDGSGDGGGDGSGERSDVTTPHSQAHEMHAPSTHEPPEVPEKKHSHSHDADH